jgi:LysR family glycine cleavage system transcriptional activator
MVSYKKALLSVNALLTFEAAARLKSFTAAARELGVSQAAVSRQIRLLEEEFDVALFQRGHRRVVPTAAGAVLGTTLNQCLETISDTVDIIRQRRGTDMLTVGATVASSHFWLLPRLSDFRDHHPDLRIRVVSQDAPFDLRAGEIDVLMRYGIPPFADGEVVATTADVVYPVASLRFAARLKPDLAVPDLLGLPLISSDAPEPSWIGWPEWFERAGVGRKTPPIALQFNHYTDGVSAALAGQGVALGWDLVVGRLVADGQLVRLTQAAVAPEATYNAVVPMRRHRNRAADAFGAWFRQALEDSAGEESLD